MRRCKRIMHRSAAANWVLAAECAWPWFLHCGSLAHQVSITVTIMCNDGDDEMLRASHLAEL